MYSSFKEKYSSLDVNNILYVLAGFIAEYLLKSENDKTDLVKKTIKDKLIKEGYIVPSNNLPMKAVVDILKIDINYLRDISNMNQ